MVKINIQKKIQAEKIYNDIVFVENESIMTCIHTTLPMSDRVLLDEVQIACDALQFKIFSALQGMTKKRNVQESEGLYLPKHSRCL